MSRTRLFLFILAVILLSGVISLGVWMRGRPQAQTHGTILKGRSPCASTIVLSYEDFGPQAMSYELLGNQWNQWKNEGHPLPGDVEVRVVVYRGVDPSQVEKDFPVLEGKSDYRYLEYTKAILYLRKNIREVESNRQQEAQKQQPEPNAIKIWDELLQTLKNTQVQIIDNLGA